MMLAKPGLLMFNIWMRYILIWIFEVRLMKYAFLFHTTSLWCVILTSQRKRKQNFSNWVFFNVLIMLQRRLKNKEVIQLDEERKKEAEKQRKEKEEKQEEQLRQYFEKEKMEEEKKMVCLSDFLR